MTRPRRPPTGPRDPFADVTGSLAVRVEGSAGVARWVLRAPRGSYLVALAPATLAARRLAQGERGPGGLVPADEHVTPDALFAFLERRGIGVARIGPPVP